MISLYKTLELAKIGTTVTKPSTEAEYALDLLTSFWLYSDEPASERSTEFMWALAAIMDLPEEYSEAKDLAEALLTERNPEEIQQIMINITQELS